MSSANDPRDASLEVAYRLPKSWDKKPSDIAESMVMMLSGVAMFSRNYFIAWPTLILAVTSLVNRHPIRAKDSGQAYSSVGFAFIALLVAYIPRFIIQPPFTPQNKPL